MTLKIPACEDFNFELQDRIYEIECETEKMTFLYVKILKITAYED